MICYDAHALCPAYGSALGRVRAGACDTRFETDRPLSFSRHMANASDGSLGNVYIFIYFNYILIFLIIFIYFYGLV